MLHNEDRKHELGLRDKSQCGMKYGAVVWGGGWGAVRRVNVGKAQIMMK